MEQPSSPPLAVGRNLRCLLWLAIDHFWIILRCNLLGLLLGMGIVTMPLAIAGTMGITRVMLTGDKPAMADFYGGMRRMAPRAYAWFACLIVLVVWCALAFLFYAAQDPFWAALGCSVAVGVWLLAMLLGTSVMAQLDDAVTWKTRLTLALQCLLAYPWKGLGLLLGITILKIVLVASGLGFLLFGMWWPVAMAQLFWMDFKHLRFAEPLHQETRGLKDFFVPRA